MQDQTSYIVLEGDDIDPKMSQMLHHLLDAFYEEMLVVCTSTDTRTNEKVLMLCVEVQRDDEKSMLVPLALIPSDWSISRFTPPKHSRQLGVQ